MCIIRLIHTTMNFPIKTKIVKRELLYLAPQLFLTFEFLWLQIFLWDLTVFQILWILRDLWLSVYDIHIKSSHKKQCYECFFKWKQQISQSFRGVVLLKYLAGMEFNSKLVRSWPFSRPLNIANNYAFNFFRTSWSDFLKVDLT